MNKKLVLFLGGLELALWNTPAAAQTSASLHGAWGLEGRAFFEPGAYPGQGSSRIGSSVVVKPELSVRGESVWSIYGEGFLRLDDTDTRRSYADVRQLFACADFESWRVTLGFVQLNWGVLDYISAVKFINAVDWLDDPFGTTSLGQPALSLRWAPDLRLSLEAALLLWRRQPTFPGVRGRFRGSRVVSRDDAVFPSDNQLGPDASLSANYSAGIFDGGFGGFVGVSRTPELRPAADVPVLIPLYQAVEHAAGWAQLTLGSLAIKAESSVWVRDGQAELVVAGGVQDNVQFDVADVTLNAEYVRDRRYAWLPWNSDLILGATVQFSGAASVIFRQAVMVDTVWHTTTLRAALSGRIGDDWRLGADAVALLRVDPRDPLYEIRRDSMVRVTAENFF